MDDKGLLLIFKGYSGKLSVIFSALTCHQSEYLVMFAKNIKQQIVQGQVTTEEEMVKAIYEYIERSAGCAECQLPLMKAKQIADEHFKAR